MVHAGINSLKLCEPWLVQAEASNNPLPFVITRRSSYQGECRVDSVAIMVLHPACHNHFGVWMQVSWGVYSNKPQNQPYILLLIHKLNLFLALLLLREFKKNPCTPRALELAK